jgi:hypothetical protein
MPDLDQGGTYRQWVLTNLGASVGRVTAPRQNILAVNTAGTYTLDANTNNVQVNVAGAVTIVLPSALNSPAGAMAVPGSYLNTPITIIDAGGHAGTNPITIQAAAGDSVAGAGSIQINTAYGSAWLMPNSAQRVWNVIN